MNTEPHNTFFPSTSDLQSDAVERALQLSRWMTLEHPPTDPIALRPNQRSAVEEAIRRAREMAEDVNGNH